MKHNIKRALALFIALLLAVPTFTFAEEPSDEVIVIEEAPAEDAEVTNLPGTPRRTASLHGVSSWKIRCSPPRRPATGT